MYLSKTTRSIGLVAALAVMASVSTAANAQSLNRTYEVSVTKVMKASAVTPILATTHSSAISLFELGQESSPELADLAESGAIGPLDEVLNGGLLTAGDTSTFNVKAYGWIRLFSMAAMVLPTNDSFAALDGVRLPRSRNQSVTYYARAYDAGSETNDDGEGFVHIANGVHGISGEISPAVYSWDGPVAEVTITRIR